jgi:FtsP/CotA-like multicopper oxidase with cupredoxin domain
MNSRTVLTFAIAVIVLAGGYAWLKPQRPAAPEAPAAAPTVASKPAQVETKPAPTEAKPAPSEAKPAVVQAPPPATEAQPTPGADAKPATPVVDSLRGSTPTIYDIEARSGRRISEPVITVQQGDEVRLRITSDVTDEFHLHGYDLRVPVSPGRSAMLRFTAKITGRFPYELHKSGLELGALEVYPQ